MPGEGTKSHDVMDDSEGTTELIDITSVVLACASALTYSEPIVSNEESFSLPDSMAALELMDPKMDCCQIPASTMKEGASDDVMVPPRPLLQGLDDDISPLPWNDLTAHDASAISLEVLTRLEALLSGASVAESTFTCLYAHHAVLSDMQYRLFGPQDVPLAEKFGCLLRPNSEVRRGTLAQHAVYAATLGLVSISEVVRSIVVHADIYEEEDFSVNTYGLEFFSDGQEHAAINILADVVMMTEADDDAISKDFRVISLVLGFQLEFLKACASMAKLKASEAKIILENTKRNLQSGGNQLNELQSIIELTPTEELQESCLMKRVFDPFMYRPLVGNAPVRKVSLRKPLESIGILRTVTSELDWAVCDLLLFGTSLGRIRRFLYRISASSINVLNRSLIVLNLYFDDKLLGQYSLGELIEQHMKQLAAVPCNLLESTYGNAFVNRLAKPIYDTLKLLVLNRNRQRPYMEAVMFQDWASLQLEAHSVDVNYRKENELADSCPPFFSHYVFFNTVWLMDHHIALGVELKLFHGHHDLIVAYWYRDFLLSSLLNTVAAMRRTKLALKNPRTPESIPTLKPRGKKKGGKATSKPVVEESSTVLATDDDLECDNDFMVWSCKRGICRGLARFIAALNQAQLVCVDDYEFTSYEKRFQKRFEPFSGFSTPPPLTYDDFRQGSNFTAVAQGDLLSSTSECFKTSKASVDTLLARLPKLDTAYASVREDELRTFQKVCIGNSAFVVKLAQKVAGRQSPSGKVSFDLQTSQQFCIIRIA